MSWENDIRNSLDAYESPLPARGFEELFSDTSFRSLTNRRRMNCRHLLFGALTVSIMIAVFFQWPTKQPEITLASALPALSEEKEQYENFLPGAAETGCDSADRQAQLNSFQCSPSKTSSKGTVPLLSINESDEIKEVPDVARDETSTESENHPVKSELTQDIKETTRIEENHHNFGTVIRGLGASGLFAAASVLNHVSMGEGLGQEWEFSPVETPTTSIHHYHPLRIGLSVGIPITQRWRFIAGVDYARYSSELTTSTLSSSQLVYFLGMPLRLDRVIISDNWFDIYAGAGVEPEVCIAASLSGSSISHNRFLFSFVGVAGAQLFITDNISAYIEPTLFWTPSFNTFSPETYHTQTPVSFSLTCGLRFFIK